MLVNIFKTRLVCPYCLSRISLEEARTTIPLPEQSAALREVALQYTICPICHHYLQITGEKMGAAVMFLAFFLFMGACCFRPSVFLYVFSFVPLVFQKKITQLFLRANKSGGDLNKQNATTQKAIQDAIDELSRIAGSSSITTDELMQKSKITFEILHSFNTDGALDALIEDTQSWLKDELAKHR